MEDETIIITTVTEKVKISELTDREKVIYNHGYETGQYDKWQCRACLKVAGFIILALLTLLFFNILPR